MRWIAGLLLLSLVGCGGARMHCPVGQQPLCQSGSMYGTRCYCVEPGGLNH